jgi:uncharacterized protein (DUF433 family)
MQLEDYFDFITEPVEVITIKGTRIEIDSVVELFNRGMFPEAIVSHFGSEVISLEQVYGTITYYLANRLRLDQYIEEGTKYLETARQDYEEKLSPEAREKRSRLLDRLREAKRSLAEANA